MESFNYNHLFYFWSVARNGSVSRASAELHISQPTVSEQIGKLEAALGVTLFERAGRGIRLSNSGQILYGYADQIFRLGQEMREVVNGGTPAAMTRLSVGFSPSVPNLLAAKLLQPVQRDKNVQLLCSRERTESLLR
ncbi:MAG TPA: LysR family transcriptional regulator, partial [Terriglobales bacterium]